MIRRVLFGTAATLRFKFKKTDIRKYSRTTVVLLALSGLLAACGSSSTTAASSSTTAASSKVSTSKAPTASSLFPQGLQLVVNQGPGGALYEAASTFAPFLQSSLGAPVVIHDVSGGGGNVAAAYFQGLHGGGSTVYWGFFPQLIMGQVFGGGSYDLSTWPSLGSVYGSNPTVLVSSSTSPYKTFTQLKQASSGGRLSIAIFGVRSSADWLAAAELSIENHIKLTPVPFPSGSAAFDAVLSGAVSVAMEPANEAAVLVKEGKARQLLQFGATPYVSNVPTIVQEGGSAGEAFVTSFAVLGTRGMPANEQNVLSAAVKRAVENPAFIAKSKSLHLIPSYASPTSSETAIKSLLSSVTAKKALLNSY